MENQEKVNILLVNDEPASLLSMQSVLAELGENIVCANSGKEALKCLLQEDFGVILMDVNMPELTGFETAGLIRQRPRFAHIPLIFMSATNITEMDRNKGYLFGAVDYIVLPILPEILQAKVAIFCDLFRMSSAYKQQVIELSVLDKKLEEQVSDGKRLNQQLEAVNKELGAVNKELEAFSYSVSHDLRNPLSSIVASSEIILDTYADKLDETGREFLESLCEEAWRMNELIEALLKLSRLGRQEMKYEPVDLTAMIETITQELWQTEPKRQVKFTIKKGIIANGDKSLLQVALQNLLSNAWKYSSKQPQIKIEFGTVLRETEGSEEKGSPVVYFIRDNGVGFDMGQADKLFRAFSRLHTDAEFKGIGIGLTIVQRVIHRHNGRIWIEAKPNEGACFYWTLGE
ncbi:MAG: response regulator [bacterium]|nr:response regulator [bacterium]